MHVERSYVEPYVERSYAEPYVEPYSEPYPEPPLVAKPLFTIAQSAIIIYPPRIGLKNDVVFFTSLLLVLLLTRNFYKSCGYLYNLA